MNLIIKQGEGVLLCMHTYNTVLITISMVIIAVLMKKHEIWDYYYNINLSKIENFFQTFGAQNRIFTTKKVLINLVDLKCVKIAQK